MRFWQIAADTGGRKWRRLAAVGCIAVGWDDLPDFMALGDVNAIDRVLRSRQTTEGVKGASRIYAFAHEMKPGDVAVTNKGESAILGIGVVTSGYLRPSHPDNPIGGEKRLTHARRVRWIETAFTCVPHKFFGHFTATLNEMTVEKWRQLLDVVSGSPDGTMRLAAIEATLASSTSNCSPHDDHTSAFEGAPSQRLEKHYARDRELRIAKTADVLARTGRLACEVVGCGFDFVATYGRLGENFAHVHHEAQVAKRGKATVTRLADLRVVCANCHAMIHRFGKCRTVDDIQDLIRAARRDRQ